MKQNLLKAFLTFFVLNLAVCALAKDKKVVMNPHVYYEGTVIDKTRPMGQGTLCVHLLPQSTKRKNFLDRLSEAANTYAQNRTAQNQRPQKATVDDGLGLKDVLTGNFNDTTVTNATIRFASGWTYSGTVTYRLSSSNKIIYTLAVGGVVYVSRQSRGTAVKRELKLSTPMTITRTLSTFGIYSTGTQFYAKDGLDLREKEFLGVPMNFVSGMNFRINAIITGMVLSNQTYESWEWGFDLNETYVTDNGIKLKINQSSSANYGGRNYYCRIELPNGEFYDNYQKSYLLSLNNAAISCPGDKQDCTIAYQNGDKFVYR